MIRLETRGDIAYITIDNPPLNLITLEMRKRLGEAVEEVAESGAKVLVVRSTGDKAFSAGGDVTEFLHTSQMDLLEWGRTIESISNLPIPTIALIRGYALGAGFEIALACDVRIVASDAVLGLPEVRLGMIPASGGLTKLVKFLGPRALYYLLLGKRMSAEEAHRLGLVDEVVAPGDLERRGEELAKELAELPPLAVRALKASVRAALESSVEVGYLVERSLFGLLRYSNDFAEGIKAFKEKRKPRYTGN
ncbi:enoyl-CoA hydratase/isomerase family protein [Pyrobaculum ferrireducens]|uniref:Enoyl-CoA hydratase n=1 Tax=Pyrobaculum ferrireducens TaxID=1104324 RepID=G7VCF9_9CREN|nr:enoyl-CoA hydratase/isomerase family protein [Pyrobaculum ferrireducens]AET32579.1 enoyl-CoA hydratase [Pyrobaculum ferrireducens]